METDNQSSRQIVRNLIIFTFSIIALGWIGRWMDSISGGNPANGIGITIWIIAPLGVSFLLRGFAGDGWKDLGIKPKGNIFWYIFSVFIYPAIVILIVLTGMALGTVSCLLSGKTGLFIQTSAVLIIPQLIQNIFEESGFRGYLAPKLYKLKLNVLTAHVIVGFIWGIWHLPYLSVITGYTTESMITLIPRFLAGTIVVSIVYGEIRILTNSVLPAILMQTVGGTLIGALLMNDLFAIKKSFLFSLVMESGLSILFFVLTGLGIYFFRKKEQ